MPGIVLFFILLGGAMGVSYRVLALRADMSQEMGEDALRNAYRVGFNAWCVHALDNTYQAKCADSECLLTKCDLNDYPMSEKELYAVIRKSKASVARANITKNYAVFIFFETPDGEKKSFTVSKGYR